MPITPNQIVGWSQALEAGGPYAVIVVLLVALFFAIREIRNKDVKIEGLNKLIYSINDKRVTDNQKVSDYLLEEGKDSTKATGELTAALSNLTDRIKEGRVS